MCLIIERQPNFEIPFDKFKTAIENNPDGFGIAYPEDGKLVTLRSHKEPDPDKIYRLINEELKEVPLTVHLRYTTAGETSLRNAHPFPVLEKNRDGIDLRMCHNGTLSKYKQRAINGESDTRAFVREFVRPLFKRMAKAMPPEELMTDEFIKTLLEDQLTAASVLSFIDSNGNTLTCNETGNGGKREDGWWYSNTYSFNPKHRIQPVSNVTPYYMNGNQTKFKDCNQMKFSKKYDARPEDLLLLSDESIDEIVKDKGDSKLLIMELLAELKKAKDTKYVH